jgi:polar amino acid transport system ATP-binding protein
MTSNPTNVMTSAPLVQAVNVQKHFGGTVVLDSVSLDISAGEVVVIIGPSGAGKSTFLRTLNQLERIDGGSIWIDGQLLGYKYVGNTVRHCSEKEIIQQRRMLGMVFQQFNLFPHMTVLQNVRYAPVQVSGEKEADATQRARDLIKLVGLESRVDYYPSQLSGGQQQRVAIARALAMRPRLLLFDEPTSSLDPELVGDVLAVMRTLAQQGQTMVIVTHEMEFALDIADRIVFMADGKILEVGTPEQIRNEDETPRLRAFIGRLRKES